MTNDLKAFYDEYDTIMSTKRTSLSTRTPLPDTSAKPWQPSLSEPCYVVAGTYAQYGAWLQRKGHNPQHYVYVSSVDVIRGLSTIHGLYIGTWKERKDIEEIKTSIEMIKSR